MGRERLSKSSKTVYHKNLLGAIFVQTCGLTSIYKGMDTACSYDTPQ